MRALPGHGHRPAPACGSATRPPAGRAAHWPGRRRGAGTARQPPPMGRRGGGSGSAAAMPGAAERGSELSEQIEAFAARLRRGGERPRSEDTARQTLSLLRKIVGHGRWSRAGKGRAAAGGLSVFPGRGAAPPAPGPSRGPGSCGAAGAVAHGSWCLASRFPVLVLPRRSPSQPVVLTGRITRRAALLQPCSPLSGVSPSTDLSSSMRFPLSEERPTLLAVFPSLCCFRLQNPPVEPAALCSPFPLVSWCCGPCAGAAAGLGMLRGVHWF